MAKGDNQAAHVIQRITDSENTVTVVFPAARIPATGVSPGVALPNPLFGSVTTPNLVAADPTPLAAPITMNCIWTGADARTLGAKVDVQGWHAEADAMARVKATDAESTTGQTHFDACDHVEYRGRHYVVLQVQPVGPGFRAPHSYSIWLKTQRKQ